MATIERVQTAELDQLLTRVLAAPGWSGRATSEQVQVFRKYLDACAEEWLAWRVRRDKAETALVLAMILPGQTVVLIPADPGARSIQRDDQHDLLASALSQIAPRNFNYAQVLIEPGARHKREMLDRIGFSRITRLLYLQRGIDDIEHNVPLPNNMQWIAYDRATHDAFSDLLVASYEDSLDCPELTGLRCPDDVIASHQAAGNFDPQLWQLIRIDGQDAGCVLLSRMLHGPMVELVYIGLRREWRGRRIGTLLMQRALQLTEQISATEMTTVVDERNKPARQLYARFGFSETARRDAYIYRWPATPNSAL